MNTTTPWKRQGSYASRPSALLRTAANPVNLYRDGTRVQISERTRHTFLKFDHDIERIIHRWRTKSVLSYFVGDRDLCIQIEGFGIRNPSSLRTLLL